MTNVTKWLIAVPFSALVSLAIPALIAGDPFWLVTRWTDTLYVCLTAGMWLVATAFVDVRRPRGSRDLANLLIPLGLILSVPISVWDRVYWIASHAPSLVSLCGIVIGLAASILGIEARRYLGRSYSPRATHLDVSALVQNGPYRWIRHPMYLAALLWIVGWPLTVASLLGALCALVLVLPAVHRRISSEERDLLRAYGDEYADYQAKSWRLVPRIY